MSYGAHYIVSIYYAKYRVKAIRLNVVNFFSTFYFKMKLGVLEEVSVIKIYLNMNSTGPLRFLIQNKNLFPRF